jgi:hypothetical protein
MGFGKPSTRHGANDGEFSGERDNRADLCKFAGLACANTA